ncbi:MAG: nucleotidyltransferase [Bacilli bacterium]|nr:nucleotidyltransferase [Bacilli bacterium]
MEKKNLTLLIMAAGMGSRFGGLKQIEPFGPHGEFLTDYSIYDAIQAGFNKVVFIIKEEHLNDFKETIGKRIESFIPVQYAFQKLEMIPDGFLVPETRKKPWGTAHAIYCAKDFIEENFLVINADDFYGRDAFVRAAEFLKNMESNHDVSSYGLIGYYIQNTLTDHGSVKRGVCISDQEYLKAMIESNVSLLNNKIVAQPLDGRSEFEVTGDNLVSMNMFCFSPIIFSYIEEKMNIFFKENQFQLEECEFLMPDVLTQAIEEKKATVQIIPTEAKWMGVTYKEDKDGVVSSLEDLIEKGVYPEELWEK